MGPHDPDWLNGYNREPEGHPTTWTYAAGNQRRSLVDDPGFGVRYHNYDGPFVGNRPPSEAGQPSAAASPGTDGDRRPLPQPSSVTGWILVDVWSNHADLWAANNLLTLAARVNGRIEVFRSSPSLVPMMLLTARGYTDAELLREWDAIRVEANGGEPGSDENTP